MASTLQFLAEDVLPKFMVLHEGLRDRHRIKLGRMVARMRPSASVDTVDLSVIGANLPSANSQSPLTYARLLAPEHVNEDYFIYLDCDFLVL